MRERTEHPELASFPEPGLTCAPAKAVWAHLVLVRSGCLLKAFGTEREACGATRPSGPHRLRMTRLVLRHVTYDPAPRRLGRGGWGRRWRSSTGSSGRARRSPAAWTSRGAASASSPR